MKQAAFDQGSFCTLLGLQVSLARGSLEVTAIGDTCIIVADMAEKRGRRVKLAFPYDQPTQFDQNPISLCSNMIPGQFDPIRDIVGYRRIIDLKGLERPFIFCFTDALARWVLEQGYDTSIEHLLGITDQSRFRDFVLSERRKGTMRTDDTTMFALGITR